MTTERDSSASDTTPSDKIDLGNYNVVSGLIQQFCQDVMATWGQFTDGQLDRSMAMKSVEAMAREMANIFSGKDPAYHVPSWRSRGQLQGRITGWVPGIKGNGDPVFDYFKYLAVNFLNACMAMQNGMAEEEVGPRIKWTLQDAAEKLSGVQP